MRFQKVQLILEKRCWKLNSARQNKGYNSVKFGFLSSIFLKKWQNNKLRENEWICGRGWNHDYFNDVNRFPTKDDLDEISTEYPICIIRACGHVCVVNSKALELAGINKNTLQIEGGQFDIDENNEPTGIFRENALNLIYNKIPKPDKEDIKNMIFQLL